MFLIYLNYIHFFGIEFGWFEKKKEKNRSRRAVFGGERLGAFVVGMNRDDFVEHAFEFTQSRAGNDDGITASVSFLGDPEEASAFVFAELYEEMFALDL